jgi:hypothetical protein
MSAYMYAWMCVPMYIYVDAFTCEVFRMDI